MMRFVLSLGAVIAFSSSSISAPKIVFDCGGSDGSAFYFEGGIVGPGQGGWKKDGIANGRIQLVVDGPDFDIRFIDGSGSFRSHRAEGSTVRVPIFNDKLDTY